MFKMFPCRLCSSIQAANILKLQVLTKPSRCSPYRIATLFATKRNISCSPSTCRSTIFMSQDENEKEFASHNASKILLQDFDHTAESLDDDFHNSYFPLDIKEEECDIVILDSAMQPSAAEGVKKVNKKTKDGKKKRDKTVAAEGLLSAEIADKKNLELQNQSLKSYLAMCMQQNMTGRALLTLKSYLEDINLASNSSQVYEVMLKEAASKCNWKVMKEIIKIMNEANAPLTLQSFGACFTCLGARAQRGESNLETLAENLLDKMASCGMQVDDLFLNGQFHSNHRELALRGVHLVLPDFQPRVIPPLVTYSSPILDSLNDFKIESVVKSPADGLELDTTKLLVMAANQFETELSGVMEIQSISNLQATNDQVVREMKQLEQTWTKALRKGIIRELGVCRGQYESAHHKKIHIYPYLSFLTVEDYVRLLTQEVQMLSRISNIYSPTVGYMCRSLGFRVMEAARIQHMQQTGVMDKFKALYRKYCQWYLDPTCNNELRNPRQIWQQLVHEAQGQGPDMNDVEFNWPSSIVQAIGDFFYSVILNNLKIQNPKNEKENVAAFYVVYRTKNLRWHKEIKPHPHLIEIYENLRHVKLNFGAALLPMLSPPLPWHSHSQGGYLVSKVVLVRMPFHVASEGKKRIESAPNQQLYPALDALNALGSIPWRINSSVLDLVVQVFNQKGSKELDVAQPPSALPSPSQISADMTSEEKTQIYKERSAYKRHKAEMYSLWCDTLYRLSLANYYRDKVFWLPHNMDFRGRVYPCPPNLTHLSNDMARSLLYFAVGKKLGREGFDWLKIHLINLTGLKKRDPVSERLRFADQVMPEILDSAQNPLTGSKWWTKSDEPWQTLAACIEVNAALKCPDPAEYVCHLPIHQDGSCNGLQHYAALGRDQTGAESVNLFPAERPQDVYSNVAALVERERQMDAANGVEIAQCLEGQIKRKVIKQTVMTTVYGVTRFGARLQIMKQLKEIPELTPEQVSMGASYLTEKTFLSLQQMFTSAKEIQDWLTDSAKLISSVVGETVEWVTPLGLPVVQPYRKDPYDCNSKPNVMKQRNAFPPNFIHSLDSSHMMLTALFSQRNGITFASIHDCFWTHACMVDRMNKVCREQFVSLHSQPILEDLSKFLVSHFTCELTGPELSPEYMQRKRLNQILHEVPKRGSFELQRVLDSVYFFS